MTTSAPAENSRAAKGVARASSATAQTADRPAGIREVAAEAAREGLDHVRFLLRLVELELIDRERRMVERRIRAARFPAVKSFDTFDFAAIHSPAANMSSPATTLSLWATAARERRMSAWPSASPPVSAAFPSLSPRRPGLSIN